MQNSRSQRYICIAVDDFGLHPGINQAALQLAKMGHVHAISCMVGAPSWKTWFPHLKSLSAAHIDLGLHLDLTQHPVLPSCVPSLQGLIRDSYLCRLNRQSLRTEIQAQLDAFERVMQRPPTYLDGHQHVHQLPGVRDELLAELAHRYSPFKPWLRSTRHARRSLLTIPGQPAIKPWLIQCLGAAGLQQRAQALGYRQNAHLLGVYDFKGGHTRYAKHLTAWLKQAGQGDLLMCHPSTLTVHCADPLIKARVAEFQALSAPSFIDQLRQNAIELRPMSQIMA